MSECGEYVLSSMKVFLPLPVWKLAWESSMSVCRASIEGSSISSSRRARLAYSWPTLTAVLYPPKWGAYLILSVRLVARGSFCDQTYLALTAYIA